MSKNKKNKSLEQNQEVLKLPSWNVFIKKTSNTLIIREPDGGDWDNGCTFSTHEIEGFTLSENKYNTIKIPFLPKKDETYYLVAVIYSTGDSFGTKAGLIEYIDLFKTREKAETLIQKIVENNEKYYESKDTGDEVKRQIEYKNEAEQDALVYPSLWQGYFESMEDCKIFEVTLLTANDDD